MKDCHTPDPLAALDTWYSTPLGQRVAHAESRYLSTLLEDSFGYFLLQVGLCKPFTAAFEACRIRHRVVLQPESSAEKAPEVMNRRGIAFRSELTRLPFASDSLDTVVLPHSLDFSLDPHRVLREVDRVLVAEGRVLLFGFNPLSPWGLRRIWPRRVGRVPWCGSQLTLFRVCDWLTLIGFHLEVRRMLVFRPPLRRAFTPRLDWVDPLGERYWPLLGGIYAVRAVKRLSAPTPTRPNWAPRSPLLSGRAVKPTARESSR